jgi:sugar/nucleoside kinase (ribokinase family)
LLNIRVKEQIISKGQEVTDASYKIDKVMDSTGAGDAFGLDFICVHQR